MKLYNASSNDIAHLDDGPAAFKLTLNENEAADYIKSATPEGTSTERLQGTALIPLLSFEDHKAVIDQIELVHQNDNDLYKIVVDTGPVRGCAFFWVRQL